ncbi:intradiol ring-cleavage dioxygenase [Pseudomonas sp. 13B_2.1_Bac1]|uniref:intradiol ring-cleavage dioxygenase n=1 Tax=Pseudomonas sp. 13B_2.1_Bac1 TaxID=2971624 RepID=UPI0021C7D482|nr:intradiol ring-cleavage dioxygenase [Pseudomonas sp. 13B_2.1_Bac1]MCU1785193.1 intradiol ring-cleavage dioxygenase [Pseudomonas sp. 13B_2.1_Bac1]
MRHIDEETITQAVIASLSSCPDDRLRLLMTSLVQHLHAFGREVKLTEAEWYAAIEFLTDAGHITDDKRQEFILLSDTLGMSMLVTTLNNRKPKACTETTVLGPFYVAAAPIFDNGADISQGAKGIPCWVRGHVRDLDGHPVAGALMDIWQSDEDGFYDVQHADVPGPQARARLQTLADGGFHFRSVVATAYPIPHDGPVGKMLISTGRHPWRPAHVHFLIDAPGFERLVTQVFRSNDTFLDSDVVFGVRQTLVANWIEHPPGTSPDGDEISTPYYTLDFDFVLNRIPS